MTRKLILIADPGIDAAFAIALALNDPELELLAVAATAGNVSAEQATRNVHVVIEALDPPRWPRIGAALPVEFERDGTDLHGSDGLGGLELPCARLHHPHPADKLLIDTVRQHPGEVAVLVLGPGTVVARALDRDADLARLVERFILVGGSWHEPGDVSAVSEFHFWCDPAASRQILQCGAPITLLPLDVTRRLVFSPADVLQLPSSGSRTGSFLGRIVPMALAATAGKYGVEGVYLDAVLGLVALGRPDALTIRAVNADVETRGELTRGMTVFDMRWAAEARTNVDLAIDIDLQEARGYIRQILGDLRC